MNVTVCYFIDSTDTNYEQLLSVSDLGDWFLKMFSDYGRRICVTGIYQLSNEKIEPEFENQLISRLKNI